ncbi:hypothetical protein B0T17DRAFT_644785 [Bombardia bombarda]|uniref:Uncharacterized protein n=1 Tax=Bombardia bombarda TaxID=252184 RepID=A0AA39WHU8_9PEZI|nr:hypothetical protein B0T17DRAFT_644785 [Bombardia bombarda]
MCQPADLTELGIYYHLNDIDLVGGRRPMSRQRPEQPPLGSSIGTKAIAMTRGRRHLVAVDNRPSRRQSDCSLRRSNAIRRPSVDSFHNHHHLNHPPSRCINSLLDQPGYFEDLPTFNWLPLPHSQALTTSNPASYYSSNHPVDPASWQSYQRHDGESSYQPQRENRIWDRPLFYEMAFPPPKHSSRPISWQNRSSGQNEGQDERQGQKTGNKLQKCATKLRSFFSRKLSPNCRKGEGSKGIRKALNGI